MSEKKISLAGITIWSFAVLFLLYELFLRILLGTFAQEIIVDLDLTIGQFSILGAMYYVVYGAMQPPVGILTEKIGVRKTLTGACFLCALGVLWLANAHSFYPALCSRLLIGFGSSFAFVSVLILALNWFPKRYFGSMVGLSIFLGSLGPICAGAPLAYFQQLVSEDWRTLLLWIGSFGLILSLALGISIRSKPKAEQELMIFITPYVSLKSKLLPLLKNGQLWRVLLCAGCMYAAIPLLSAYWGTTYLQGRGLEKTEATFIVSMIWLGYAIGSPLIGKISDLVKRRKIFVYLSSISGLIISSIMLYLPFNNVFVLLVLFFCLGLFTTGQSILFAVTVEYVPHTLHSIALGMNNGMGMLFGAGIPIFTSFMMQLLTFTTETDTPSQFAFTIGLSVIPICYLAGTVLAIFGIQETFCRQQHEMHKIQRLHKATDIYPTEN